MDSQIALILSSLAFLISLFSFFFFKSYLKRRTSNEYILSEIEEEANQIIKTINQATERDISIIEERQQNLRLLIKETEKRISVFNKEVERLQDTEAVKAQISVSNQQSPEKQKSSEEAYQELGKKRYQIKDQPDLPLEDPPTEQEAGDIPPNEQIIALLQAGFSVPLIAASLKISIAEVEITAALLEDRGNEV